jgi:hypothetical protein
MLVSSRFNSDWFDPIQTQLGALITVVGGFELLLRFNPMRIPDFTPLTRLNPTFDGLALVAAVTSFVGIVLCLMGRPMDLEYILMGRAIDMIRVMRFFQVSRSFKGRLCTSLLLVLTFLCRFSEISFSEVATCFLPLQGRLFSSSRRCTSLFTLGLCCGVGRLK